MFPEVLPLAPLVMLLRESMSLPKTSSRLIPDEITDEPYDVGDPVGGGDVDQINGRNVGSDRDQCALLRSYAPSP
jgi:hypothetical protein